MNIIYSKGINNLLDSVRLGIIRFNTAVNDSNTAFWELVTQESVKTRENLKLDQITSQPVISETRNAYKKCGKDPSRYRPSADSLIRRIVKGNELYKVNNVVDVLNLISIQSGFSIGGYDFIKIKGEIAMDIGSEEDEYYGIGRGLINIANMPVLRDDIGVFGSPTSDSERTMISKNTTDIAFVFFDFGCSAELEVTMHLTKEYLKQYCNANSIELIKKIINSVSML